MVAVREREAPQARPRGRQSAPVDVAQIHENRGELLACALQLRREVGPGGVCRIRRELQECEVRSGLDDSMERSRRAQRAELHALEVSRAEKGPPLGARKLGPELLMMPPASAPARLRAALSHAAAVDLRLLAALQANIEPPRRGLPGPALVSR